MYLFSKRHSLWFADICKSFSVQISISYLYKIKRIHNKACIKERVRMGLISTVTVIFCGLLWLTRHRGFAQEGYMFYTNECLLGGREQRSRTVLSFSMALFQTGQWRTPELAWNVFSIIKSCWIWKVISEASKLLQQSVIFRFDMRTKWCSVCTSALQVWRHVHARAWHWCRTCFAYAWVRFWHISVTNLSAEAVTLSILLLNHHNETMHNIV